MKKILGYIFALVGLIGISAYAIPDIRKSIPNLPQIADTTLIIISAALLVVGLFIVMRSRGGAKSKKGAEVPIFQGKNIVGYRRH